ncbi:hypothetical protein BO70DRAFT_430895 [Aspergillus heteromorphus CBS 117.55]|uniref:Uncharacterized protein n=1 Tax=Aspergillus heteromorphus CBS 117.55 TaxID=1448321 RepID=A0A317VM36_9EURO|nr:uncharacterized protein BO70DRAFT_430895 [Aspergillus heteromorphus CBS 117.55]PWY75434.1 hypothetical protein BO70DRAFT_430895 [Aspergillus heteromorphus CBS 117.55]
MTSEETGKHDFHRDEVRPREQIQHPAQKAGTRYQFIISERSVTSGGAVLFVLGSCPNFTEAAADMGAMSVDELDLWPSISKLQYAVIPWGGCEDGLTMNLGLYLSCILVRLADEENDLLLEYDAVLSHSTSYIRKYPSHGPLYDLASHLHAKHH